MPTESGITLPPDGTGKPTRTNTITTAYGSAVHMPVYVLADADTPANVAKVDSLGRLRVSDSLDNPRTPVVLYTTALATVTTEALVTFTTNKAGVAGSSTTYTVTSGKTLRVTTVSFGARNSLTTGAGWARIALRSAYSTATPTTTSPAFFITEIGAAASGSAVNSVSVPEGLEFPSGTVIALSHVGSATTMLETITILGFEY